MLSKDRLREITLFRDLSDEDIEVVASVLEEAFHKKDSVIWEEGTAEQGLHIVEHGKVRICRNTREGHKQVLAVLKANNFFGELSILDGRMHSASAEAVDDTKVLILHKSSMDKLLQDNPQIAFNIVRVMTIEVCELLRVMNAKFMDMVNYTWE
ncbi:MAG TPA: cyclic nucleotide-binding domain-containing protein [Nitrospirae bacterium]|nr:cAMP receptor protein [bacterium BMS3Abin09]GBE41196.1 cAMP receptor protein [bacterium BMS3Bbin09]HDH34821.1 cyclic nucleotide-binding domain-containing protein [Nitrospirota bacterium]HDN94853.1 cyclic nucleotide-binding domain-containing protein [Nitrospirota bacterium]HDO66661.1 cyclic nucleotide-binding domain-containing protein [Nitrospirota bacterium]